MYIFSKKVIFFLVAATLVTLLLFVLSVTIIRVKFDFTLDHKTENIILGHSHSQCAYDDASLPGFKNLSNGGESYFYTYFKLKKILEDNPQIKNVFLEFTNTLVAKKQDDWIWGFEKMNANLAKYGPFMEIEDLLFLYSKNQKDFLPILSSVFRTNLLRLFTNNLKINEQMGGYQALEYSLANRTDTSIKALSKKIYNDTSAVSLDYLKKIVGLCQATNVTIVFIRSPQHLVVNKSNEHFILEHHRNHFKQQLFWDFDSLQLQNKEFGDLFHLNKYGAKKMTSVFYKKYTSEFPQDK